MHAPERKRSFLFLQGPPGPFFSRLGDALRTDGHAVHRINFNGGDRISWPGPAVNYRGSAGAWPAFFDAYVREHAISDLALFGDCRPLHRAAHPLAAKHGLRIHVFEEGYIRPDWITLERDGVNGNSTLPRDPDWFLEAARDLPALSPPLEVPSSFRRRAREATRYYTHLVAERWRFPGYRSHRSQAAVIEGLGWVGRFTGQRREALRAQAVLRRIAGTRYFLFPLQLDSDAQIRFHSPFGSIRTAIDYVVDSFARAAPPDRLLVVKLHPLDNGTTSWRRVTLRAARRLGVADRVLFLEAGDIARLVADAEGLVTINSTTGTLSVGAGVPTAVLGDAVYDVPRITHQETLDQFWPAPVRPDPQVWDAFCRVLQDRCLVRGGFLSDAGLDLLVRGSLERLTTRDLFDVHAQPGS